MSDAPGLGDGHPKVAVQTPAYEADTSAHWLEKGAQTVGESNDEVFFGASAPTGARPGDQFVARFAAYPEEDEALVRKELSAGRRRGKFARKSSRLARGARLRVALHAANFTVEGSGDSFVKEFVWQGEAEIIEFVVGVPINLDIKQSVLRFNLLLDGILLAQINLDVQVAAQKAAAHPQTVAVPLPKRAFASYSWKDRLRVLDRTRSIEISAGIDVFLDCLDQNPGDEWKRTVRKEIQGRDIFMLFWSNHAAVSTCVAWEYETALAKKKKARPCVFQIHPLENGVQIPRALSKWHLADTAMDVRFAESVRRDRARRAERRRPRQGAGSG